MDQQRTQGGPQSGSERRRRGRRAALGIGALVLAVFAGGAARLTLAVFTSSSATAGNPFPAGTVVLSTDRASTALLGFDNMLPGDRVTAPILISNTGTGALRYSMTTSVSEEVLGLGGQLQLQVRTLGSGCSSFDGTLLYGNADPTATSGTPPLEALDKPVASAIIGDPAGGQQTGDRVLSGSDDAAPDVTGTAGRADAQSSGAPSSETLCFRAYLPLRATGNAFQSARVTTTFAFAAEQTANNP